MTDSNLTKPMQGRTIEKGPNQYRDFIGAYWEKNIEDTQNVTLSDFTGRVPREQRVILDDIGIEAKFQQETHNPSIRDRVAPDIDPDEEMFKDLQTQLTAAQDAAIFFEAEARKNADDATMWYNYYLDAIDSRRRLREELDRKKRGFWGRFKDAFFGDDTLYA